jgi:hypothetical protein
MYIGVYCSNQCVYNLTISMNGPTNGGNVPMYLIENVYQTGKITAN